MKTSKTFLSAVIVSMLGLSATLSAPQALAVDKKAYSAFGCVKIFGPGAVFSSGGSIGNQSSAGFVAVQCPAVKDATHIQSGVVQITDQNPTDHVGCMLFMEHRNPSNSAVVFNNSPAKFAPFSGDGTQLLSFGPIATGQDFAQYYYSCRIPAVHNNKASMIHTYQVVEAEPNL